MANSDPEFYLNLRMIVIHGDDQSYQQYRCDKRPYQRESQAITRNGILNKQASGKPWFIATINLPEIN